MTLEVTGLTKRFGGIVALNGVDLRLEKGELVGMIGPNGSGKTTAFNVITGIHGMDGGSVVMEGEDLSGMAPHRIARRGIARTFQNIRLFRDLSVLDNVRVAYHPRARCGPLPAVLRTKGFREEEREIRNHAEELLALVSLRDRRHEKAMNLPYGDQRRLEIVRALASKPKILLLDEPAAGMNPSEVGKLKEFILRIRERFGLAILLIEHQMRLVMEVCERIVVMDFGEVIATGTPAEVRSDARVIEAYLGKGSAGWET